MTDPIQVQAPAGLGRRRLLTALAIGGPLLVATPALAASWHNISVAGSFPRLSFTMIDASTGKPVTAADFRGKLVMLYFGYTQCPDVCPLTLHNVTLVLDRLGKQAADVTLLFVTVDPDRDTLRLLRQYTAAFSPRFIGLRGTPNQLAQLARTYRIAHSVSPATKTHPYEVTHSSAIYVFDRDGNARLLVPSLGSTTPDVSGTVDDLAQLLRGGTGGWLASLTRMF